MMYVPYKDGVLLVASRGGAEDNPAWIHNLRAHPKIGIRVRGRYLDVVAKQASRDEKEVLWPICVDAYPSYADYQSWTERDIPVFACLPEGQLVL